MPNKEWEYNPGNVSISSKGVDIMNVWLNEKESKVIVHYMDKYNKPPHIVKIFKQVKRNSILNSLLPNSGRKIKIDVKKGEVINISCKESEAINSAKNYIKN